jgi:hypothetical protein
LQVGGAAFVLGGLGWTWLQWSEGSFATWLRKRLRLGNREMRKTLRPATENNVAMPISRSPVRPPDQSTDMRAWVTFLEARIDEVRRRSDSARREAAERSERLEATVSQELVELRMSVAKQGGDLRAELKRANLSGLGWAALGGLLTLAGLFLAGPPQV